MKYFILGLTLLFIGCGPTVATNVVNNGPPPYRNFRVFHLNDPTSGYPFYGEYRLLEYDRDGKTYIMIQHYVNGPHESANSIVKVDEIKNGLQPEQSK